MQNHPLILAALIAIILSIIVFILISYYSQLVADVTNMNYQKIRIINLLFIAASCILVDLDLFILGIIHPTFVIAHTIVLLYNKYSKK